MVLCPTGSSVNPSAPPYSWITWANAQTWLGVLSAKFSFLSYLITPVLVNVTTFCATEPAQPVYPGDATVVAASHDPVAFEAIITYLKASATWYAWTQLCRCNASGTPGCETQLYSHGADLPTDNTGPSRFVEIRFNATISGLSLWGLDIDSDSVQTVDIFWRNFPTTITNFTTVTLTAGWNRVYFSAPATLTSGDTFGAGMRSHPLTANVGMYVQAASPAGYSGDLAGPAFYYGPSDFSVSNPTSTGLGLDPVICVSSPTSYTPPGPVLPVTTIPDQPLGPCISIGDLCGIIQPTIAQVSLLMQRVDLLQRRLLPFAWIAGPPSVGLTGHGTIAVQDVLGCIVTLTTVPATWGSTAETPRRLIPSAGSLQGSLSPNADDNRQVHYDNEIFLFHDSWATGISYNFRPGVIATITPILPEP